MILDQGNIDTLCTRVQFAQGSCPKGSIYGYARAWSPLLNRPLGGPVYMASNGGARPLPDHAVDLEGEIRIILRGEIDTARGGRLRNTFIAIPDAPVSRFALTMTGGKRKGLLVNSTDLCRSNRRGQATFFGHNGRRSTNRLPVRLRFRGCKQVRKKIARRKIMRRKAARQTLRERSPESWVSRTGRSNG